MRFNTVTENKNQVSGLVIAINRTVQIRKWMLATLVGGLVGGLPGCAAYHAKPLSERVDLPSRYSDITIDRSQMPSPELENHIFDASHGLDMDEVAMLAVINNPDLKVARADARIAHAQAFAAGLLPDPQFAGTYDFVTNPQPGSTSAFSMNLAEDINALIRHHFDSQSGKFDAKKTDLSLLWQEWQVVANARTLYIKLVEDQRTLSLLQQTRTLYADRYQRTQTALDRGLLTLDAVTPHQTALQDIEKQIHDLERQLNTDRHDLNALLGLAPEASVPLQESISIPEIDEARIMSLLPDLPRRRPDFIALQYGYRAEDARYRAAIVGQFPTFNIGFNRARDNSNVYSSGFGITLSLPIFNGNRGNIAIEEATRQKLYDDYQTRLNAAYSDVHRILAEQRINERQLREVDQGLASLTQAASKADLAFQSHNIDALAYASLQASLLSKRIEKIGIEQSILQQRVALLMLLGGTLPTKHE
jgi:outer membrane protein TolC